MFEFFTESSVRVIMIAQTESKLMKHLYVGTEQLLLGLIGSTNSIPGQALKQLKVRARKCRKEIMKIIGEGIDIPVKITPSRLPFTPKARRVLETAYDISQEMGHNFIASEHIMLGILEDEDCIAVKVLKIMNVKLSTLRRRTLEILNEFEEEVYRTIDITTGLPREEEFEEMNNDALLEKLNQIESSTPILDTHSKNLTREALEGKLSKVVGREEETKELIEVLARRYKNNAMLLGEPGVGKTAIVEGLAQRIVRNEVPNFLDGVVIASLDISKLLSGTKYRGEFEERIQQIVNEVLDDPYTILMIDEIHTIVGTGSTDGSIDIANILKPALASGTFWCIGATTPTEYNNTVGKDAALARRFQNITIEEPSIEDTIEILEGIQEELELHHGVEFSPKAIVEAAKSTKKYVSGRFLPDKAIDALDQAASKVRLSNKRLARGLQVLYEECQRLKRQKIRASQNDMHDFAKATFEQYMTVNALFQVLRRAARENEKAFKSQRVKDFIPDGANIVTEEHIAEIITNWTGIPTTSLSLNESTRLEKMEEILHESIIGQNHAVKAVAGAIRRSRLGLGTGTRPIASFIFAGPTGVGKTELTKAITIFMFGDLKSLLRFDMSEYQEKHTIARLVGSPPGYVGYEEGGQLTQSVKEQPYSVVLFDEVEKAHSDIYNILLALLDDGRLTDGKGQIIDFSNTVVIMTSNMGSGDLKNHYKVLSQEEGKVEIRDKKDEVTGWAPDEVEAYSEEFREEAKKIVMKHAEQFFRPEFLNRLDELIVFDFLTKPDTWNICTLMLKNLKKQLWEEKQYELVIDPPVQGLLTDLGYDPEFGARPLRRMIISLLEEKISKIFLDNQLFPKTKLLVTRKHIPEDMFVYTTEICVDVDYSEVELDVLKTSDNDSVQKYYAEKLEAAQERMGSHALYKNMGPIPRPEPTGVWIYDIINDNKHVADDFVYHLPSFFEQQAIRARMTPKKKVLQQYDYMEKRLVNQMLEKLPDDPDEKEDEKARLFGSLIERIIRILKQFREYLKWAFSMGRYQIRVILRKLRKGEKL